MGDDVSSLDSRIALVTGAARGIGREAAVGMVRAVTYQDHGFVIWPGVKCEGLCQGVVILI